MSVIGEELNNWEELLGAKYTVLDFKKDIPLAIQDD